MQSDDVSLLGFYVCKFSPVFHLRVINASVFESEPPFKFWFLLFNTNPNVKSFWFCDLKAKIVHIVWINLSFDIHKTSITQPSSSLCDCLGLIQYDMMLFYFIKWVFKIQLLLLISSSLSLNLLRRLDYLKFVKFFIILKVIYRSNLFLRTWWHEGHLILLFQIFDKEIFLLYCLLGMLKLRFDFRKSVLNQIHLSTKLLVLFYLFLDNLVLDLNGLVQIIDSKL